MRIEALYTKYFQKSKVFLYPTLGIKRGACAGPEETYLSLEGKYKAEDAQLIAIYPNRSDFEFSEFKKKVLLKHTRLTDFEEINEDKLMFIFDYTDMRKDWEKFVNGQYSQMDALTKSKILGHFDKKTGSYAYMDSYLYPERYFSLYAHLLGYEDDKLLRDVGELCSKPDLEKETFMISQYKKINV